MHAAAVAALLVSLSYQQRLRSLSPRAGLLSNNRGITAATERKEVKHRQVQAVGVPFARCSLGSIETDSNSPDSCHWLGRCFHTHCAS